MDNNITFVFEEKEFIILLSLLKENTLLHNLYEINKVLDITVTLNTN